MKIWLLTFFFLAAFPVCESQAQFKYLTSSDSLIFLADKESVSLFPVESVLGGRKTSKTAVVFNVITIYRAEVYGAINNLPDSTDPSFIADFENSPMGRITTRQYFDSIYAKAPFKLTDEEIAKRKEWQFKEYYFIRANFWDAKYNDSALSENNSAFVLSHKVGMFTLYVIGKTFCMIAEGAYHGEPIYPTDFQLFVSGTVGESFYDFARTYQRKYRKP